MQGIPNLQPLLSLPRKAHPLLIRVPPKDEELLHRGDLLHKRLGKVLQQQINQPRLNIIKTIQVTNPINPSLLHDSPHEKHLPQSIHRQHRLRLLTVQPKGEVSHLLSVFEVGRWDQ